MQAEAAGIEPDVAMNPILLKPTSDCGSQVIVNGEPIGTMTAAEYFKMKHTLKPEIMKAFNGLADKNDIIVIEGAGSPAEINIKKWLKLLYFWLRISTAAAYLPPFTER